VTEDMDSHAHVCTVKGVYCQRSYACARGRAWERG